jgi:hypothetical protein
MDWKEHGIKTVRASDLDPNTPQTPGMSRAAAITHALCSCRSSSISLKKVPVACQRADSWRETLRPVTKNQPEFPPNCCAGTFRVDGYPVLCFL